MCNIGAFSSASRSGKRRSKWLQLGVHGTDEKVRAEPLEAVEIDLAEWCEGIDEDDADD